jgi:hypothetical protein
MFTNSFIGTWLCPFIDILALAISTRTAEYSDVAEIITRSADPVPGFLLKPSFT